MESTKRSDRSGVKPGNCSRQPAFVVYDDQCRLCTALMHFVLRHQHQANLVFVPVSSWIGSRLLRSAGMTTANYDSMVFAEAGRIFLRSEAIVRILMSMGFPWRCAGLFLNTPRAWRDWAYALIAGNRYTWFGRHGACACATAKRPRQFRGHHAI